MKDTLTSSVVSNTGGLIAFFIAFFTPIFAAMICAGVLIMADTITGIMKAYKAGIPITSKKLSAVLTKMVLYQLLIVSAHAMELYMLDVIPVVKLVLGSIALIEFKSILENASEYLGYDLVKEIFDKLKRK